MAGQRAVRRAKLVGVVAIIGSLGVVRMTSAFANGSNAGPATVTDPASGLTLTSGGSTTPWTLKLPAGAACSGDTASQGYHVFGYIVPSAVDPSTLSFTANGPTDPTNNAMDYPLVDTAGHIYANASTAAATRQVINVPTFNWAAFSIDGRNATAGLPAGSYNLGIACANASGAGDQFWNATETFAPNSTDPAGETWSFSTGTSAIQPTANVNPSNGLVDGQSVTVTYSAFANNSTVYLAECTPAPQSPVVCSSFNVTPASTDINGNGSATYAVHTLPNAAQPNDITCDAAHLCSVVVETSRGSGPVPDGTDQPTISFASTPPTSVPESPWPILLPLSLLMLGLATHTLQQRRKRDV